MYSRKRWSKGKKNLEDFHSQSQDSKPESGNENNFSDLDIHVAKRKGIQPCTSHPISNFVNYEHLSSSVLAFVTKSTSVRDSKHRARSLEESRMEKSYHGRDESYQEKQYLGCCPKA